MVKRIVDDALPFATIVANKRQRCKRPRTDEFLDETANFRTVLETCRFFEMHLTTNLDMETLEVANSKSLSISNTPSSAQVLSSLRQSMSDFEMTHELYCSQLRESATAAIQLTDKFQSFSAAMNAEESQIESSPLSMLNLGPDMTNFLKQQVSDYAGVPSPCDLQDWKDLGALLR